MYSSYSSYKTDRAMLERKYNKLLKARKDLLMHFDWANSRGECIENIE